MTKNWIGRIAIALGTLVLLLAAAAAVLIATFDANRYKTVAIDWMKAGTGRAASTRVPTFLRREINPSSLSSSSARRTA